MVNSKQKGARGEREWCAECGKHGFPARRSQQFCGNTGAAADVLVEGMEQFHPEVKRVQRLQLETAMAQAIEDSAVTGKIPYVAYKRNHGQWFVTMRADDWFNLVKERK